MELQRLYVTLALNADDFKAGMATVTGVVAAGAIAASAAVTAVAVDGVKAAMDMEAQMSGIAAIFSATADEVAPLGDLIKELGLNPNLKVNATEAADAIEMLGKNGLTMAEILDGAAESTVLLANSTGADFATAANIGTDAMALFNIGAEDMINAVDGITSVTVNSKFDINDYALALAQGGGVASAVGVTFNDFNATIAGISPLFKSGSDAGTSFKTMLTRLQPATGPAATAMEELGLLTEEGASKFFDAEGNMKSMAEVAGIMSEAFGPLTEAQRLSAMQTIFGADAMRAAVGLMDLGEQGFRELSATMSQTDALAAAATRMDNLSGAMEIFEGIVDTVKLSLGQALLPVIRMFVDWLIVVADQAMPAIEAAFSTFATVLASFFAHLGEGMSVMDAFLEAIWNFIPPELAIQLAGIRDMINEVMAAVTAFLAPIWEAISAFVSWEDVLITIGISIAATLIPIIIGLITTIASIAAPIIAIIAVVALLRNAWENDWMGIQGITQTVWTNIQSFITVAWEQIQNIVNAVISVIGPAIENFTNNASTSLGKFDTLLPALGALWEALGPIVEGLLQFLGAQIVIFIGVAVGMFNAISNAIGPFIDTFVDMAAALIQILTGIANFITGFVELVVGLFQGNSEAVEAAWQKMGAALGDITSGFVDLIFSLIQGTLETTLALAEGFAEGFVGFFEAGFSDVVDTVQSYVGDIIDGFVEMVNGIVETVAAIDWPALGASIIDGMVNGIKSGIGRLKDAAVNAAKSAFAAAMAWLQGHSPSRRAENELGIIIPQGMAIGIEKGAPEVVAAATAMAANTMSAASQGLTDGISAVMQTINTIAGQVESETISKFAKAASAVFEMIGTAIDATRQLSQANFPQIVQGWHLHEQMIIFRKIVARMMEQFALAADDFELEFIEILTKFAKAVDEVFGLIETVIEGATMLSEADFVSIVQTFHLHEQMIIFRRIVARMMEQFALAAAEMNEGMSKEIQDFAKAANELFEIIEVVLIGATKLSEIDFGPIVQGFHLAEQITIFRNIIRHTMREFGAISEEFSANEISAISALSVHISEFITNLTGIIDQVFVMIEQMERFVTAQMPNGLGGITHKMIMVLQSAIAPARNVGMNIGNAFVDGITSSILSGIERAQAAITEMISRIQVEVPQLQPVFAGGGAGEVISGGGDFNTVVLENGAFQVTINDAMDAEEFKFSVLEILRELTE